MHPIHDLGQSIGTVFFVNRTKWLVTEMFTLKIRSGKVTSDLENFEKVKRYIEKNSKIITIHMCNYLTLFSF